MAKDIQNIKIQINFKDGSAINGLFSAAGNPMSSHAQCYDIHKHLAEIAQAPKVPAPTEEGAAMGKIEARVIELEDELATAKKALAAKPSEGGALKKAGEQLAQAAEEIERLQAELASQEKAAAEELKAHAEAATRTIAERDKALVAAEAQIAELQAAAAADPSADAG